jgi:mitochondrial intermediate peptidase
MLAQTELQHISGTRVKMDFVEVPSILMESFSKLPEVLSFGRHYKTGEKVPLGLLDDLRTNQRQMEGLETHHQVL